MFHGCVYDEKAQVRMCSEGVESLSIYYIIMLMVDYILLLILFMFLLSHSGFHGGSLE